MSADHDHVVQPLPAGATDPEDRLATGVAAGERQRLRSHVAHAGEVLSGRGPIITFVHENPIHGLQRLPFDRAVSEAQRLLGGQGYLSNEAFRRLYASGRITQAALVRALEAQVPHLATRPPIEVRRKQVEAREVLLAHLLHGITPLPHGTLRWQVTQAKATRRSENVVQHARVEPRYGRSCSASSSARGFCPMFIP